MMKTAVEPDFKSKTLCISKSYTTLQREKERDFFSYKFYQKLFVILISMSTFLIFPESPKELANICETYNPTKLCNVM